MVAVISVHDVVDGGFDGIPEDPYVRSDGERCGDRDDTDHRQRDAVLREILSAVVASHAERSLPHVNSGVLARVLWHSPKRD